MSQPGRHHAILIGSSQFASDSGFKPLRCPENDVDGMQQLLTSPDFGLFQADNLLVFKNRPHYEILRAINPVFRLADPQDLILLYYSGHGELDKKDHLHLATPDSDKEDIETTSIPAERLRRLIDNHRCKRIVLILDCCYSGAIKHDLLRSTADSEMKLLAKGIYVLTASTAMETAEEKEGDEYGLLTKHILEGIKSGQAASNADGLISVDSLYQHVSRAVARNGAQTPTCYGLDEQGGHLYIARAAAIYTAEKLQSFRRLISKLEDERELEDEFCDQVRAVIRDNQPKRDKKLFELLDQLQKGLKPGIFSSQWMRASGTSPFNQVFEQTRPLPPKGGTTNATAKEFTDDLKGVKLEMVYVPAGKFTMGSEVNDSEKPPHEVSVPAFYIGKFQITQAQWKVVMGDKLKPGFKGDDLPMESISWEDSKEFCQKLTKLTNKAYRLPSEAEWEYACRAGTTTEFAFGDSLSSEQANFNGNYPYGEAPKSVYREKTTPVGSFEPNAFGLFDMHGNVWEWCEDVWHGDYKKAPTDGSAWLSGGDSSRRVLRGGSWYNVGHTCRSALRYDDLPGGLIYFIGLRVVLSARTLNP